MDTRIGAGTAAAAPAPVKPRRTLLDLARDQDAARNVQAAHALQQRLKAEAAERRARRAGQEAA